MALRLGPLGQLVGRGMLTRSPLAQTCEMHALADA
jgi:hypothetical protein